MLSDACFGFLTSVGEAARKLAEDAHWYASPSNPLRYGEEIDALRRACMAVAEKPTDADAGAHLLHLAASVLRYHDTLPDAPEQDARKKEMMSLVRALQANLTGEEAALVPMLVDALAEDGAPGEEAASRLKGILARLGKPAYDLAIKVVSDVGSATVKKMFGL